MKLVNTRRSFIKTMGMVTGTAIAAVILSMLIGINLHFNVHAQTSTPTIESEVSVSTGSGYGSTGQYVRTFSTVDANYGSDITYTSDTTNGDYFTINTTGLYAITYSDGSPNTDYFTISVNGASTTSLISLGSVHRLCFVTVGNNDSDCQTTVMLSSSDVIRAHWYLGGTNGLNPTNSQTYAKLIIVRVK